MKTVIFTIVLMLVSTLSFSQEGDWVQTEGEITEITTRISKRVRVNATVKFNLEDGTEQLGNVEIFKIPFLGSIKSVGDKIIINYNRNNPVILETTEGKFISNYGLYILIFFGIILSIKPFIKNNKRKT